ncbi:MAG: tetratricopeptide repeat protein, partial [Acidobacteriota bacterium]
MGNGLMQIHQVKQSLHYQKRALKLSEEFLGPNHPETNWIKNDLAMDLTDQGRLKEAEPLARQALAGQLQASGEGTPPVLQ